MSQPCHQSQYHCSLSTINHLNFGSEAGSSIFGASAFMIQPTANTFIFGKCLSSVGIMNVVLFIVN